MTGLLRMRAQDLLHGLARFDPTPLSGSKAPTDLRRPK